MKYYEEVEECGECPWGEILPGYCLGCSGPAPASEEEPCDECMLEDCADCPYQ